ncbi:MULTISPECIES: hypothetical protein [unclassified Pseudomonas]|uniref:hypothetical protein n=1 Tax=unclassified Pseudomonas TaxID=196821 RepID=UPI0021C76728|nr:MULTISPECIES: hypothetical protein [unclassified Pseudomonas]MCU1734368.1 hypothetical protein [Pseudomonas sp. 20P_3.2_Bac4]MCU1745596.1 hypothetical protein [Pseudomonas sp. 20P_3.2_Bac5]
MNCALKRPKNQTLTIRTTADMKHLLRMSAEKEHRSTISMMEVLMLNYAQEHGLKVDPAQEKAEKK